MPQIIAGEEEVGRPIWLKQRGLKASITELVFVGINQVGLRMVLQKFCDVEKRIGFEHVIVIDKSDPLSARECDSMIWRSRDPTVFSEARQYNALVARGDAR